MVGNEGTSTVTLTGCTVDLASGAVTRHDGGTDALTQRERALLVYLVGHPSRDVTRDELLTDVWGYSDQVVSRAIDSTMRRLREKIELDPSQPRHLITAYGTGYRFEPSRAELEPESEESGEGELRRLATRQHRAARWCVLGERRIDLDLGTIRAASGDLPGLTAGERSLVNALADADGELVETEVLARVLWGRRAGTERALPSVIHRIRRKIEPDPDAPRYLLTVRNRGFRLVIDANRSTHSVATLVQVRVGSEHDPWGDDPAATAEWLAALVAELDQSSLAAAGVPTGDGWCHLFADHEAAIRWAEGVHAAPRALPLAIAVHRGRVVWWPNATTGRTSCAGRAVLRCGELAARTAPGTLSIEDPATVEEPFVGRKGEQAEIVARLGATRVVTLAGPGGIGKSRLAHRIVGGWTGPVVWCDLTHAGSRGDLVRIVARGLELSLTPNKEEATIRYALAGRGRLLVVLDPFETVLEHAAAIADWAAAAPEVRFLVTSRLPLGLDVEAVVPIGPLDTGEARELMVARSRERGISPSQDGDLATRTGGVPLAVELAVGRLDGSTDLGRLAQVTDAVEGTLAWTWELLDDVERALLSQLSVFEGGFTAAAAEAVCGAGSIVVRSRLPETLGALLDRSLVAANGDRLSLLDPVRAFVRERVTGAVAEETEIRHGAWCARFARRMVERPKPGVPELVGEYDNLVAAHRAALRRGDAEQAVATAYGLYEVLRVRGPFTEAVDLLRGLVSIAPPEELGHVVRRLSLALRAAWRVDEGRELAAEWIPWARLKGDRRTLSSLLADLAQIEGETGQLPEGRARMAEAVAIARAERLPSLAYSLNSSAVLEVWSGDQVAAAALYREALELDPDHAVALGNLAATLTELRRLPEAEDCAFVALERVQQDGDLRMEAFVRGTLSLVALARGELESSLELASRSRDLHRRVGNRRSEGLILDRMSGILASLGRPEEALVCAEAGIAILRELGVQVSIAQAQFTLAASLCELGRLSDGLAVLDDTLALAREIGEPHVEVGALAEYAIRAPTSPTARARAERAIDLAPGLTRPDVIAMAWWSMGATSTDPAEAIGHYDRCLAHYGDTDPNQVAIVLCRRGQRECALGRIDAARRSLAQARTLPADVEGKRSMDALERSISDRSSR